jgi:hypothetical protein
MDNYIAEKLTGTAGISTLAKRIPFLNELAGLFPSAHDFSFLNQTDQVMKRVQKSSNIDTQWNCIWHVIAAGKTAPEVVTDTTMKFYNDEVARMKVLRDKKRDNNVRTPKQVITLETELVKRQNELTKKIDEFFAKHELPYKAPTAAKYKTLSVNTFGKQLQELVICGAYLFQPALRNDWGALNITGKMTGLDTNKNYLYVRGSTMRIIMNVFKNAKSLGQVILEVRPKLVELLKIWISVLTKMLGHKPVHLLYYNITKTKCDFVDNDEALRRQIPRISKRIFAVEMSINDYRHLHEIAIQTDPAYATMKDEDRKALHRELLHGIEIARLYNVH